MVEAVKNLPESQRQKALDFYIASVGHDYQKLGELQGEINSLAVAEVVAASIPGAIIKYLGGKGTGVNAEGIAKANQGTQPGAVDNEAGLNSPLISLSSPFSTAGINPNLPSVQSIRADLYNEYKAAGLSAGLAKDLADGNIKSGSTIPIKRDVDQTETLYKFVPSGNSPGPSSYYFTKSEFDYFKSNPEKLAQEAGLPYKNFVGNYDVYAIKPKSYSKPVVFESKVAEIQQGGYHVKGGANQTIVPNLKDWSIPEKIGDIKVYENE
jgi:filamentous hemagglutinin